MSNVIKKGNTTFIINGGNLLDDSLDWDYAKQWEQDANKDREIHNYPIWGFDCGFKLDYDGGIVSVSSRFYPPSSHGGKSWDGNCTIYVLDKEVSEKSFDCKNLDDLKNEVENYIKSITLRIIKVLK